MQMEATGYPKNEPQKAKKNEGDKALAIHMKQNTGNKGVISIVTVEGHGLEIQRIAAADRTQPNWSSGANGLGLDLARERFPGAPLTMKATRAKLSSSPDTRVWRPLRSRLSNHGSKPWKYRPYLLQGEPIEVETQI
jgi:hypothetical protein